MSHECPTCGHECYCDGEDHGQDAPEDCAHECEADPDGWHDYDPYAPNEDCVHMDADINIVTGYMSCHECGTRRIATDQELRGEVALRALLADAEFQREEAQGPTRAPKP